MKRDPIDKVEDEYDRIADDEADKVRDAALFAVALDRVRRDKGERHTLDDVAAELEILEES